MIVRCLLVIVLSVPLVGCGPTDTPEPPASPADKPAEKPKDTPKPVASKKKALNPAGTISLETFEDGRRRVLVEAAVCLREGPLELLMCRRNTKEHEAILHTEAFANDIHAALLATGAKVGSPVKYSNEKPFFTPASGTSIKISLQYEKKSGVTVSVDAKEWVRNANNRKALDKDWVFAGSRLFQDPEEPKTPPYYLANNGDVICVSNFVDAMLDLPINSPKENNELAFEAWTERIPPLETKVTVILEPVIEKKEKEKDKK
jgi:hypothetical protein